MSVDSLVTTEYPLDEYRIELGISIIVLAPSALGAFWHFGQMGMTLQEEFLLDYFHCFLFFRLSFFN